MVQGFNYFHRSIATWVLLVGAMVSSGWIESSRAQVPDFGLGGLGQLPGDDFGGTPITLSAKFEAEQGGQLGRVLMTAEMAGDYHIYSVTQPKGGPLRTTFKLVGKLAEVTGDVNPNTPPEKGQEDFGTKKVDVEKHYGQVTWTIPIRFLTNDKREDLKIKIEANGQVCSKNCVPFDETLEASFAGYYAATPTNTESIQAEQKQSEAAGSAATDAKVEEYRDKQGHVAWSAVLQPRTVNPGSNAELKITAVPDEGYHVYHVQVEQKETNYHTQLIVTEKAGLKFGKPTSSSPAEPHDYLPGEPPVHYHEGKVTWSIPVFVPEDAKQGELSIKGLIGYQACDANSCDPPMGIEFSTVVEVTDKPAAGSSAVSLKGVPFKTVAKEPTRLTWVDETPAVQPPAGPKDSSDEVATMPMLEGERLSLSGLASTFGLAMVAGFILNFMPCVLPVIGLKIAGFVQEGSGDNRRTTYLTLWYVAGIMAFLLGMAIVLVITRDFYNRIFLWGEQYTDFNFRLGVTIVVFAMALSFLGVWDIPIPGFAHGERSGELMAREGAMGAFFKGIFSTVLATPCSGPFLGPVIASSLVQPAWMTLLLFFGIALGMALPYLAIAVYPKSISFLPKPGPWMDTFKQFLAFPLLLTTVFFISQFDDGYRMAVLTMLIGVWFSCWMFGLVPGWADLDRKIRVWGTAIVVGIISGWASFRYLGPGDVKASTKESVAKQVHDGLIPWEPYTEARLDQLTAEGKTVIIDFTADWCLVCQTNLATAIETKNVAELIERNGIVPLIADWTDKSPEIKSKLIELKSAAIPVFAIYPGKSPKTPVVLRDALLESQVLRALEEAGPSQSKTSQSNASQKDNKTASSGEITIRG